MDYRDNRQRWAESHQVVHFYASQWCTFTPALTMVGHIEESNHEKTFIKCLDILTERGTAISDSTNSSTYAPKIMAKMPERERMKRRKLEKAMFSLFSKGDIVNEPYGPPSRLRSRIARKPSEGGNDDDA